MKKEEPLVSIIIPCYNCKRYISDCIKSVKEQKYHNIEILAINDGSSDNTAQILNRLSLEDKRVVVIEKDNGGVSSARNAGLERASGEFIAFVDADDTLPENAIGDLVDAMSSDVDMVIGSNCEYWFYKKRFIQEPCRYSADDIKSNFDRFNGLIKTVWKILYRKSIIEENALRFNQNMHFGEDYNFNLNYTKFVKNAAVIENDVYNYYVYRSSAHKKYFPEMNEFYIEIFNSFFSYYGEEVIPENVKSYFIKSYLDMMTDYYAFNTDGEELRKQIIKTYEILKQYFTEEDIKKCLTHKRFCALEENEAYKYIRLCYSNFDLLKIKNRVRDTLLTIKKTAIK